jgi:hypothetical protein
MYHNGFVYYTPKKFIKDSVNPDHNITTGYIDRKVYDENPMTFEELSIHMGSKRYELLFGNVLEMFRLLKPAFTQLINKYNKLYDTTSFMIMGCDVAPHENLSVKLMEINKGPDLTYKDDRDKAVKLHLVSDMWKIILDGCKYTKYIQV